ncbi:hypothetical protein OG601_24040 [Streptomyces sp. NBC_01239]|uniref:hypothetical protein n=1 Tax=Streptomyces sp. NBC_01239 TaxID=2903792 RepID=UPI0022538EF3|nr:hypothetical protein [Streptomyces sp. NBC_01239]MCX4813673.1 hypothetical protein [Streptomyces sp. NBC_01239]
MIDERDSDDWPVPPPFMFGCQDCVDLLIALKEAINSPEDSLYEQVDVAEHIVMAHPDQVPAPHTKDCALCPMYQRRKGVDLGALWAQHRTRDLFMPESAARSL